LSSGRHRLNLIEGRLLGLAGRLDISEIQRKTLLEAADMIAWDDAIHIAAPWERRAGLCGLWYRNLVPFDAERPNGIEGCWTCLLAADWLTNHSVGGIKSPSRS